MPRSLPPSSRTSASTSNPAPPASFAKSVKNEIITCFPQLPRQHPPLAIDHQRRRGRQRPARNHAAQQRRLLPFPRHLEAQARFGRLRTRNRTLAPRRRLRPNRTRSVQRHLSVTIRERRLNISDTKFLTSAPATDPSDPASCLRPTSAIIPSKPKPCYSTCWLPAAPSTPPRPPCAKWDWPPPRRNSMPSPATSSTNWNCAILALSIPICSPSSLMPSTSRFVRAIAFVP